MAFLTGLNAVFKKAFAMISSWERLGFLRFCFGGCGDIDCSTWGGCMGGTVEVIGSVMVLLLSNLHYIIAKFDNNFKVKDAPRNNVRKCC